MDLSPQVSGITYFIFQKKLFIHFWLCWAFVALHRLSLVAASGDYSLLWCVGFALQRLLLLLSPGSRHAGFSSWGTRAQSLQLVGLVAPRYVKSSWTRNQTHVPCTGGWMLIHRATREVLIPFIFNSKDFL